ncbi:MAG TPA: nucleoside 2-deoxyribosyltransferase [archaeon]|nr:nucleoside 2-deoxyribosyltransferase [archaeon]
MKKKLKTAFISGPIQGFETKQGYRKILAKILTENGYKVIDPWKRERVLYRHVPYRKWWNNVPPRKFIQRDLKDIEKSDLLVAYLPRLSAGTLMELFYAKQKGKNTVVISRLKNPSPWIIEHVNLRFETIKQFEKWLSI